MRGHRVVTLRAQPAAELLGEIFAALADVEQLSGRPGAGEITILADDVYALDALEARLRPLVPPGADLLTWLQVSPELRMGLEADGAFFDMAVVIILLVVLLGVTSAQLTGVLERRKEFAVLAAIGMRGVSLVKVVLVEGMVLGLTAAVSALAWAAPLSWKLNVDGVNLAALMNGEDDSGMAFGGLLIDPIFHPGFGAWMIPYAFLLALIATITAGPPVLASSGMSGLLQMASNESSDGCSMVVMRLSMPSSRTIASL